MASIITVTVVSSGSSSGAHWLVELKSLHKHMGFSSVDFGGFIGARC
jgi:hypothetical protein